MDKAFLVTGATGGVGQSVVKELTEKGLNLVLLGRNEKKLKELNEETENVIFYVRYDLEDIENIATIFQKCVSQGIVLNGLIHCAGLNLGMPIKINDVDAADRMMRINLYSFVEMGKYFCKKKYTSENSSLIAISSMATIGNAKGMCMYSASKAALNSAVQTMAKELMPRKSRVNAILPGYLEKMMDGEKRFVTDEAMREIQPLGLIEHLAVAKLAAFLVSRDSCFITGALIPIGGGQI